MVEVAREVRYEDAGEAGEAGDEYSTGLAALGALVRRTLKVSSSDEAES